MAEIFQPPQIPPIFIGGRQPYEPRKLPPQITAVPVNTNASPPQGYLLKLGVWQYIFEGGRQPYAGRQIAATIPAPVVVAQPAPLASQLAIILSAWQPDPWSWNYQGAVSGQQPYGQRQLNPSITAVPVNNPPFGIPNPNTYSSVVATWQPDPWSWVYSGPASGLQPYAPRQVSPGIPGRSVDNPPRYTTAITSQIVSAWQPDPWSYPFVGGFQPYAGRVLYPIPTVVVTYVPSSNLVALTAILGTWQSDPWSFDIVGPVTGMQPYGQRQLNAAITAVPVNQPPGYVTDFFTYSPLDPTQIQMPARIAPLIAVAVAAVQPPKSPDLSAIIASWQVDPWTWSYEGPVTGAQPYGARQLNPSITAVPVNNPPFGIPNPSTYSAIATSWQPDPWVYSFEGAFTGLQPYGARQLNPYIINPHDLPPFSGKQVTQLPLQIVYMSWFPPDPIFQQLHAPPFIAGQSVDQPTPNANLSININAVISSWQPDPWTWSYAGPASGLQPYAPRQVSPGIAGRSVDNPPFNSVSRQPWPVQVVLSWQPPDPIFQQTHAPPFIAGQSVDNPPFVDVGRTQQNALVNLWQPDPWTFGIIGWVTGLQPYGARQLPPQITAVAVNNPPFTHPGQLPVTRSILDQWQPDPWTYTTVTPPILPRFGNPFTISSRVDNPPFSHYGRNGITAEVVQSWQPDVWYMTPLGAVQGLQPFGPRQLPIQYTAVPVNNPPFSNFGRLPNMSVIWTQWDFPPPPIQPPRYYPIQPAAVVTYVPFTQTWMGIVVQSWQPADPQPVRTRAPPFIAGMSVDQPPPNAEQSDTTNSLISAWQPPDPTYAQRQRPPFIAGMSVDNPPTATAGRVQQQNLAAGMWQPDPWVYTLLGPASGLQPYAPRQVSPGIPGRSVDQPQPNINALANLLGVLAAWQPPDPIFTQQHAPPFIAGQSVDQPPFVQRGRSQQQIVVTYLWQPEAWTYSYLGPIEGRQPYGPPQMSPGIPGQSLDPPPVVMQGRAQQQANVVAQWQPDPYAPSYMGPASGLQPYAPRKLFPSALTVRVDNPPFDMRRGVTKDIVAQWQPLDQPANIFAFYRHYTEGKFIPFTAARILKRPLLAGSKIVTAPVPITHLWPMDAARFNTTTSIATDTIAGDGGTAGSSVVLNTGPFGVPNTALDFTANDPNALLILASNPIADLTKSYSVAFWFMMPDNTVVPFTGPTFPRLFTFSDAGGNTIIGGAADVNGTAIGSWVKLSFDYYGTTPAPAVATANSVISSGQWIHTAHTFDAGSNTSAIYINGVAVPTVGGFGIPVTSFNIIGAASTNGTTAIRASLSRFSDFRIYGRALSATDITTIMELTTRPVTTATVPGKIPASTSTFTGALDPSSKSTNAVLSNNNLTIRQAVNSSNEEAARSVNQIKGRVYLEFSMDNIPGNDVGVGVGNANAVTYNAGLTGATQLGGTNLNGISYFSDAGEVLFNNVHLADLGAFSTGDIISVAVDTNALRVWVRRNGSIWNGSATADPATGIGGFDISTINPGPLYVWIDMQITGGLQASWIRPTLAIPAGYSTLFSYDAPKLGGRKTPPSLLGDP